MVEVMEKTSQGWLSRLVRLVDERMLYSSVLIGLATYFLGLTIGISLYFLLFIELTVRTKASLHMLITFMVVSGVTLLSITQFQYREITYIALHLWAVIIILCIIRWIADLKVVSYLGAVIARTTRLDRLGGHIAAWVLAGIAVGYGTVQLWYNTTTTDWGVLTIIALSLLLPAESRMMTLFLYTSVGVYALLTTLILWKGLLIIQSDFLFFVQSYLPDLMLPFLLVFSYSRLSSKNKRGDYQNKSVEDYKVDINEQHV